MNRSTNNKQTIMEEKRKKKYKKRKGEERTRKKNQKEPQKEKEKILTFVLEISQQKRVTTTQEIIDALDEVVQARYKTRKKRIKK